MRTIGVVTVGRSDYTIYRPLLHRIEGDPDLSLRLMVASAHLSPEFGLTVKEIEADGIPIAERIEMLLSSDTPEGMAKSMGLGILGMAQAFSHARPDFLVVLGDRFEIHASVIAAAPFKIPVAHIHGGEITQGALDDAFRHSITKLSHLHFVATEDYRRRLVQMGEEPWRVMVSGALSLDNLASFRPLTREELESRLSMRLERPPLLVTYHPVTLESEQTEWQVGELLQALKEIDRPLVFTMPNADAGGRVIRERIRPFVAAHPQACFVDNLGYHAYFSMMATAGAMVGNSSSGIIEAPSFALPVVNIGSRQTGRTRARNVIDVGYSRDQIVEGIGRAMSPAFRAGLEGIASPFGDGRSSERIVRVLKELPMDARLITKTFCDLPFERVAG
ncbi:MAG: UDP-N-acetylglucosamine 2-epimerase (hydrolyzing) [Nitrospirae bacterium]|nr:UDP-N-acetylglucosamine 2-epimerase (hydrolyzing) [Nitrospirota bacterium]